MLIHSFIHSPDHGLGLRFIRYSFTNGLLLGKKSVNSDLSRCISQSGSRIMDHVVIGSRCVAFVKGMHSNECPSAGF